MTLERTHELIVVHAKPGDGNNRNLCHIAYGEDMQDFREFDLKQWKLQHGTTLTSALKN